MIARYAVSISLGVAVTFVLLFIMQLLIETGRGALTESKSFRIDDFVRVQREELVETRKERPDKPRESEQAPELPKSSILSGADNVIAVSMSAPTPLQTGFAFAGIGFGISDSEYLPIVKVAPIYPARALALEVEGYVIVQFTVTRTGTTRDVVVIESTSTLFNRAAVEAASKFKYKPRVIDGEPVEVTGVVHKITFEIER